MDAAGTLVSQDSWSEHEKVRYTDSSGNIWLVGTETGLVSAVPIEFYFTQTGCVGTAYYQYSGAEFDWAWPPPRFVGKALNTSIAPLVRGDHQMPVSMTALSHTDGLGVCQAIPSPGTPMTLLQGNMATSVSATSVSFAPPLHLEHR